jgi:hypothetical protein
VAGAAPPCFAFSRSTAIFAGSYAAPGICAGAQQSAPSRQPAQSGWGVAYVVARLAVRGHGHAGHAAHHGALYGPGGGSRQRDGGRERDAKRRWQI